MLALLLVAASARDETKEEQMYADFARESFKHPGNRRDGTDIGHPGYVNFNVSQLECQDGLPQQVFALWKRDQNKEIIFALRGTPLSINWHSKEIWHDKEIAEGKFTQSDRAKRALRTLRAIQRQFPGYTISMTGHSLGGTTVLLLLAQDAHNNIIEQETNQPASAIDVAYVYNPYKGHYTEILVSHGMEPFYELAFTDRRVHGVFVFGDMLSAATKGIATANLPEDRLYIAYLPLPWTYPPLSYPYAHNVDGTKGSVQLTSPGYVFGEP